MCLIEGLVWTTEEEDLEKLEVINHGDEVRQILIGAKKDLHWASIWVQQGASKDDALQYVVSF